MKYPQLVSMPSAVSDWLEEQLEARGIDAVVYTRYVLSLLYRDPVDIICPDQDLHFTNPNKEVRRSGGGRKRFCRSTDYWGHVHADADQLKRSAAVECLKSASDQKCGIESLVDELCEKLKEIKSDSTKNISDTLISSNNNAHSTSSQDNKPQDPAKRYYAAFPPLSRNPSSSASPNIITLIPKWFGSPKKKGPRSRQNRSSSYEEKLHFKLDTENMKARSAAGKQRFNYFTRNKKDIGYCRNISKSIERPDGNEWDFFNNNNVKAQKLEQDWPQQTHEIIEKAMESSSEPTWEEAEESMYDDLPVDIRDLLDSPTPQDVNVEMMNMANMRDTGSKKFIQCGTNIISSIWSNDAPMEDATIYDNTYNSTLDNQAETPLDFKFSSISIDKNVWSSDVNVLKENETNSFFESCGKKYNTFGFENNGPWSFGKFEKWSDTDVYDNEFQISNVVTRSLMKLNHNREQSSFTEVKPRPSRIFSTINKPLQLTNNAQDICKRKKYETEKDKDDLLNSAHSHFKPINEKVENRTNGQYEDGTTFVIPSSLDKVNFQRSESGTMYLEAEYGVSKKYLEYKKVNDELTLKFNVNQNDKACQTESNLSGELDVGLKTTCEDDFYFPGDQELLEHEEKIKECTCGLNKDNSFGSDDLNCPVHSVRPDSMMAEIFGKFELKCDKCNNNTGVWSKDWSQAGGADVVGYDKQSLRNIWSGGEVCMACLGLSGGGRPPPSREQNQLREDITQDGEQLLSDLKSYMEELPVAELSCNLNELIGAKEWKQTVIEETVPIHSGSFSFATRLQEDCLLKMATIPTLRSVTL